MKNEKLKSLKEKLPVAINEKIDLVLTEQDEYVADELVELCEEILNQLAAIGFAVYVQQAKQKEVYNDFLIQLFTSKGNAYNAGPLYRWAANMIKELDTELANKIKPLFWDEEDGKMILRKSVHELSLLRNKVMHGFFVLPPEVNREEADKIGQVLEELVTLNFFNVLESDSFHFLQKTEQGISFSSSWSIAENDWASLEKTHQLGEVAHAIKFQLSPAFSDLETNKVEELKEEVPVNDIATLFTTKQKGAYSVWQSPNDQNNTAYLSFVKHCKNQENYLPIYYELTESGITHNADFLLSKIIEVFKTELAIKDVSKDTRKAIASTRKQTDKQAVVILNNIHLSLFNKSHLLHLADFLYENNIVLVAFGVHHPWMNKFFNDSISIPFNNQIPSETVWSSLLDNYLRFKGPNKEMVDELTDYKKLVEISECLLNELQEKKKVVARRFADEHDFPMEYVHEVFGIMNPFFQTSTEAFIMDEVDELYGFPKELTEASSIFFALGRRDAKLEYQHKLLSL